MKIYLDVALITSTVITLICLEVTARIVHRTLSSKRAFIAGSIGGLSSLIIVIPSYSYTIAVLITVIKILSFPLITAAAFGVKSFRDLIRNTAIFTGANLVYTGIVLILWELSGTKVVYLHNYTIYFNISILQIAIAVIITYALLTAIEIVRKISDNTDKYIATYVCGNYQLSVPAVADTGNKLCDSFTRAPVVIFYCDDLYFHYGLDTPQALGAGKFRLLPFDTINGSGILPVTYNGKVEIGSDNVKYTDLRCCIGITRSNGSRSRAIFNPVILE